MLLIGSGELEGGNRRRATDPIWSPQIYDLENSSVHIINQCYIILKKWTKTAFFREELMPIDANLLEFPLQKAVYLEIIIMIR